MEMKIQCDNNQIVATLLAALVMDRAGRRLLLNTSALLMVSKISIIDLIMSICPHLKIVHGRLKNYHSFLCSGYFHWPSWLLLLRSRPYETPCWTHHLCKSMLTSKSDQINLETISRQFDAQVPVISLSVFVFGFSLGFGPIPWLMMSELFAPEVGGQFWQSWHCQYFRLCRHCWRCWQLCWRMLIPSWARANDKPFFADRLVLLKSRYLKPENTEM